MARHNQSLVTLTPPTWNQTVSWTSAATSRGTKKIRRMVSAFGKRIVQTNYIKRTTGGSGPLWGRLLGAPSGSGRLAIGLLRLYSGVPSGARAACQAAPQGTRAPAPHRRRLILVFRP